MSSHKDWIALMIFVGSGLAMALAEGYLVTNLPEGHPVRAVGLALLIVGALILVVWRIMRLFPRL